MPATEEPLLTIGQLAARAGLNTSHIRFYERVGVLPERQRHIRELADEKLPHIDALIARAQAVKQWLQVARHCDWKASTSADSSSTRRCSSRRMASTSTCATSAAALDLNTTSRCSLGRHPSFDQGEPLPMCLPDKSGQPSSPTPELSQ